MNNEINLNEPFGYEIFQTVVKYELKNNLEIGSWDGEGSTLCFVEGMKLLTGSKKIDCIEVVDEKINLLKQKYKNTNFVIPQHGSSISYSEMLHTSFEDIWNSPYNKINKQLYSLDIVKSWFDRDIENLKTTKNGIITSLKNNTWDSVLIDGGEFTGYSEFKLLKDKTRFFFLDDVHHAFKCNQIYKELLDNNEWKLLTENKSVRNGYAIFKKI